MSGSLSIFTSAVHTKPFQSDPYGSVSFPIYLSSNYMLPPDGIKPAVSERAPISYSRKGNVNEYYLEDKLCGMTGAEDCIVFSSGVAALSAVFTSFVNSGDHIICSSVCYNATYTLMTKLLPEKYNIQVSMIDTSDLSTVIRSIRQNTKLIHVECPGNPTTAISDIEKISDIAKSTGALLSVDATYAGPICIHPLKLGADLEIYSMTKYINGHGDALGGCVLANHELTEKLRTISLINYGGNLSPFNAWLITRGIETLPIRMVQHCRNAEKIAEYLETCPAVRFVRYPGLKSHPQHELATKIFENGFSGMLAFDINGDLEQHYKFMENLKLIVHAVSLGDVYSLILYNDEKYEYMPLFPEEFQHGFYRLSVGIEDADDLIEDIKSSLVLTGLM